MFKPTSLCNEIYRIIAKILVARLKSILIKCISSKQSIFIEDRQIMDNLFIASECLKSIKAKKGKKGWCTFKVDVGPFGPLKAICNN